MRKLIAWAFMYSLDGLLADEGTEYWQFCFGLPVDPAALEQKIGGTTSRANPSAPTHDPADGLAGAPQLWRGYREFRCVAGELGDRSPRPLTCAAWPRTLALGRRARGQERTPASGP